MLLLHLRAQEFLTCGREEKTDRGRSAARRTAVFKDSEASLSTSSAMLPCSHHRRRSSALARPKGVQETCKTLKSLTIYTHTQHVRIMYTSTFLPPVSWTAVRFHYLSAALTLSQTCLTCFHCRCGDELL